MEKAYNPKLFEDHIYQSWESINSFRAYDHSNKPTFTMPMPPPNVTGALHNGHALFVTLQDTLIRWKRMSGFNTLWLPGTDHAGIATQMVVEREISQVGLSKHKIGRDDFVKRVWEWKEKHGEIIVKQMKKLGASPDWERARFTMDPGMSKAVRLVFEKLYNEGLIYRGTRITSRCIRCETVLSDLEVITTERKSHLWYIRYFLLDKSESVVIATTRPETLLGDTAVAVNPEDERYLHLVGKQLALPLMGRPIPIIADSYVDKEFGTGVLKVTPAHDFNDYELGKKHNLPLINILEPNGKLNANAGPYGGLSITEARERVIENLTKCNALVKTEAIVQQIGICQRCESIVEPVVSDQWFMKMKPLAEKAIEAARKGESLSLTEVDQCNDTFKIIPETWYSTYYHWMENIRDWCISRQLWWGHRVPAWYCKACKSVTVSAEEPKNCKHCHSHEIYQDEDVLDTWFSAGLWPFATLGWPEKTAAYQKFYPGSILETGFDILFFWVARMLMLGLHFNDGKIPFRRVYLHAMVRDEKGKKMSKTKGNVIDPLEVIEKYGADAFRFTLLSMSGQGRDIKLNTDRVEGYKAFCNKLWNASRYVMMRLGFVESDLTTAQEAYKHSLEDAEKWIKENRSNLHAINKWILSRFETTADSINKAFEEFRMGEASLLLYDFIWKDFCDWYIEFSKELLKDANIFHETQHCLVYLLHKTLRLAHPCIPFITEEIYKHIPETNKSESTFLILQPWPCANIMEKQTEAEDTVELWKDVIEHLRTFRGENGISPKARPEVYFDVASAKQNIFHAGLPFIISIAQLGHLLPKSDGLTDQADIGEICCNSARLYISLRGLVDVEGEVGRLEKEKHKIQNDINFLQAKLNRQEFLARAPKDLVKLEQERLGTFNNNLESINKAIERLLKIKS